MTSGPVRRSQLITTFGVGAMMVVRDGTSLIAAGLDHWFERDNGNESGIDVQEYCIQEWRLARSLGVNHFRLPPDFRPFQRGYWVPNVGLTIPFLRFPQWYYCTVCGRMYEYPLTYREKYPMCRECKSKRRLVQVPFVAVCDHGHIRDFPWREWVHQTANPKCAEPLYLRVTGGATLGSQVVECRACGLKRSLNLITVAYPEEQTTHLSRELDPDGEAFNCDGRRPWLGRGVREDCGRPLWGVLRSAANVHYSHVRSAIYLPRPDKEVPEELLSLLEAPPLSTMLNYYASSGETVSPDMLRTTRCRRSLERYTDRQICKAVQLILSGQARVPLVPPAKTDDVETSFRREEYNVLRQRRSEQELVIESPDMSQYGPAVREFFSRVTLIKKLRETRALIGFTRVYPESEQSPRQLREMLWLDPPDSRTSWLPACVVHGEGLFLEFNEKALAAWQKDAGDVLKNRIAQLASRYQQMQNARHLRDRIIGPRFLLAHTFAHVLINYLTFDCGYSTAALRERLYVSEDSESPMCGLLIYTAAGDAEGTLGGLVRMGEPGRLERAVAGAIAGARWCSADPVCMEMGAKAGQGPDSCNLAACHNCALLPETACEEFNRFLDRGVLVGAPGKRKIGFFAKLL